MAAIIIIILCPSYISWSTCIMVIFICPLRVRLFLNNGEMYPNTFFSYVRKYVFAICLSRSHSHGHICCHLKCRWCRKHFDPLSLADVKLRSVGRPMRSSNITLWCDIRTRCQRTKCENCINVLCFKVRVAAMTSICRVRIDCSRHRNAYRHTSALVDFW